MPRSIDDEIKEYELKIIKLKYDMMVEEYERKTAELAECAKICKEIDRISSAPRKKCPKCRLHLIVEDDWIDENAKYCIKCTRI